MSNALDPNANLDFISSHTGTEKGIDCQAGAVFDR